MTLKLLSSYAPVDEEFDKVSLLLHGDGTNGSTTIVDSSSSPKAVTAVGDAQISTAQSKFGGSSIAFDGNGDYLTSAANAAFDYAAGDFTIEGWFNNANISSLQTVIGQASFNNFSTDGYVIRLLNSKLGLVYYNNSGSPLFILGDVTTLSSNVWYHFAATREGNVFRLFISGILEASVTNSISFATGKSLYVGRWEGYANRDFNGYIDDFRITKGVARYTANFTPPTAPFPPDLGPRIPQHIVLQSPASNDPLLDLNTQPSLDLQFATSKTLDDRVSGLPLVNHQRDASSGKSAGTYVGSDGLIKTSPVNLFTYSEEFDNAIWTKAGLSIFTVNAITAPDGTSTGSFIAWRNTTEPLTSGLGLQYGVGIAAGTSTLSCFAKIGTARYLALGLTNNAGVTSTAIFDLQTGTVNGSGSHPSITVQATSISNAGSGWYKCSLTSTYSSTLSTHISSSMSGLSGVYGREVSGDGTSGIYIWGAQLQEGALTDYIPTTNLPSGAPRFDHDPVTGESLGLLIEEERTNLVKYSEDFAGVGWNLSNAAITPNSSTAPNGTLSATLLYPSSSGTSNINRSIGNVASMAATSTIFAKAAGKSWLRMISPQGNAAAWFNLSSGVRGTVQGGVTASITDAGNGWYRCSVTQTATFLYFSAVIVDGDNINTVTASGTDGILIFGAQLEAGGSFPTSYIPTTSSAVTRAADVASITGTNFTSWYNQSEGTVAVEAQAVDAGTTQLLMHTYGVSTTNNRGMYYLNNSNRPSVYWVNAGTSQALLQSSTPAPGFEGNPFKYVAAYNTDDFVLGYDGGSLIFDTSGTPDPTIYRASLGSFASTSSFLNGHISRLTYYPYRLADATLQEITS